MESWPENGANLIVVPEVGWAVAVDEENPPKPVENGELVAVLPRGDAVAAVVDVGVPPNMLPVGLNWFWVVFELLPNMLDELNPDPPPNDPNDIFVCLFCCVFVSKNYFCFDLNFFLTLEFVNLN
jgi:hypothetical protein